MSKKKILKVNVPQEVAEAYKTVKKEIDYPVLMHDRWAVEKLLTNKAVINPKLMINYWKAEGYVKRDAQVSIYISDDQVEQVDQYATDCGTNRNTVLIQAIMDYSKENLERLGMDYKWNL